MSEDDLKNNLYEWLYKKPNGLNIENAINKCLKKEYLSIHFINIYIYGKNYKFSFLQTIDINPRRLVNYLENFGLNEDPNFKLIYYYILDLNNPDILFFKDDKNNIFPYETEFIGVPKFIPNNKKIESQIIVKDSFDSKSFYFFDKNSDNIKCVQIKDDLEVGEIYYSLSINDKYKLKELMSINGHVILKKELITNIDCKIAIKNFFKVFDLYSIKNKRFEIVRNIDQEIITFGKVNEYNMINNKQFISPIEYSIKFVKFAIGDKVKLKHYDKKNTNLTIQKYYIIANIINLSSKKLVVVKDDHNNEYTTSDKLITHYEN